MTNDAEGILIRSLKGERLMLISDTIYKDVINLF